MVKLIAEIGINHNGDVNLAHKMLSSAADNGANIVKFQVHIPDKEMVFDISEHVKISHDIYKRMEKNSLTFDELASLKRHATDLQVQFLATPFSPEAVDWLEKMEVDSYKIGSGECSDFILLDKVICTGKKIFISTGMSYLSEVENTVKFLRKRNADFVLMHCTSEYPCSYKNVSLGKITEYKNKFNCDVGFSDHSPGIYASIASVALGAVAIERHFTTDRSLPGPDQSASVIPSELKQLSEAVKVIESCMNLGAGASENVRQLFMHGITAIRDIEIGEEIKKEYITSKRPLIGIPSSDFEKVVGKKAIKSIKSDSQINWSDISDGNI